MILCCPLSLVTPTGQLQTGPPREVPFKVLDVSPSVNALNVARTSVIEVTFSVPVDPASINHRSFSVFGKWTTLVGGTVTWLNGGRRLKFVPARAFSPGETVTVSLTRQIRSQKRQFLDKARTWTFWAGSRASSYQFSLTDTLVPGVTPYGAFGGDQDADGDVDLFITNEGTNDACVFLNDGAGHFGTPSFFGCGSVPSPNEPADMNLDGKLDMVVSNTQGSSVSVLMGNGDGSFQPQVAYSMGVQPRGLIVADLDGDGDADVATANRGSNNLSLRRNNGDGTLGAMTSIEAGVSGETALGACDMNNDGLVDLVVAAYSSNQFSVLLNNGLGGFLAPRVSPCGSRPWMLGWGDVNGDGAIDAAAALSGSALVAVALNDGSGTLLAPTTYSTGSFPIAVDVADLNGDGTLDLAVSNFSGRDFTLYTNNGNGTFGNRVNLPAIQAGSCTTPHDVDGDGDIDITCIDEVADRVFLFMQQG